MRVQSRGPKLRRRLCSLFSATLVRLSSSSPVVRSCSPVLSCVYIVLAFLERRSRRAKNSPTRGLEGVLCIPVCPRARVQRIRPPRPQPFYNSTQFALTFAQRTPALVVSLCGPSPTRAAYSKTHPLAEHSCPHAARDRPTFRPQPPNQANRPRSPRSSLPIYLANTRRPPRRGHRPRPTRIRPLAPLRYRPRPAGLQPVREQEAEEEAATVSTTTTTSRTGADTAATLRRTT